MPDMARLLLAGGPFAEKVFYLPPDTQPPLQIAWGGVFPWGFATYLHEWTGETVMDGGRTDALIYRCTGRRLEPEDIPPVIAEAAELWADTCARIREAYRLPPELIWPGV